jgi:hypothetical protein
LYVDIKNVGVFYVFFETIPGLLIRFPKIVGLTPSSCYKTGRENSIYSSISFDKVVVVVRLLWNPYCVDDSVVNQDKPYQIPDSYLLGYFHGRGLTQKLFSFFVLEPFCYLPPFIPPRVCVHRFFIVSLYPTALVAFVFFLLFDRHYRCVV